MEAVFKFDIDQKVKTLFGQIGIIELCAVDNSRVIQYSVKTKDSSMWYKEDQLLEFKE